MRKPTTVFAGILAGTLLLAGCSTTTGSDAASTTAGTEETTTTTTAATSTDLTEVAYEDLGVNDLDTSADLDGAIDVTLSDSGSTGGDGVSVDGDTVTITAGGTYRLSGRLSAGQVVVDTADEDVTLVLDGVDITSPDTAAIDIEGADEVVIWLEDGSTNTLSDAADATAAEDSESDVPNATLYSTADLWIAGDGALSVNAVAEDGIASKDGLVIESGSISVTAADDGIRGKDYLVISGGDITVDAEGDGLKSTNEALDEETAVGVVWISGGTFDIASGVDGIDAVNQVTVEGGDLSIAAGDDGITTDGVLHVSDGTIDVSTSVEGLEGGVILLSGGTGTIKSSDDGVNVSGGTSSGGGDMGGQMGGGMPGGGEMGERPSGGMPGESTTDTTTDSGTATSTTSSVTSAAYATDASSTGTTSADTATTDGSTDGTDATTVAGGGMGGMDQAVEGRYLEISGGTWYIDADGDGLDSNGTATMTGGTVVVDGPTSSGNGALDVNGEFTISGGTLAASGASGMLETPTADGQGVLTITFASAIAAGTPITVTDADGSQVATFTTGKISQSLVLSSDGIASGETYTITTGATVSGDAVAGGLVLGDAATGGDELGTVTAD
ncbi:carbohydrate-binding domain-containing protein [Demequina phytophila]|uniref:carbohydrate-binding domain-containing protein n=1 Tax=Demequina phytophila TaxID=1638981 RepID=UPI000785136A|nr:carbohydrate-binding domain-containing protein [Demequina phytophila]